MNVFEDTPLSIFGISVVDIDANNKKDNMTITIGANFGSLQISTLERLNVVHLPSAQSDSLSTNAKSVADEEGKPNAGDILVLTGLVDDVNEALKTLIYTPDPDFNGAWLADTNTSHSRNPNFDASLESLSFFAEDAESGSIVSNCFVSVIEVNDPPVITGVASFHTSEDEHILLTGLAVVDVDIDETRGAEAEVIIESSSGVVTLEKLSGLRFFE
eukprot:Stramenopile-MAST_4_protein_6397